MNTGSSTKGRGTGISKTMAVGKGTGKTSISKAVL
jgi:hypothetical protein